MISLPSDAERERKNAASAIDADFISRLPELMEKV